MSDVINISDNYTLNNASPDAVFTDKQGDKWYKFSCIYTHEERPITFIMWAKDFEDAEARIKSIKQNVELEAQITGEQSYD